MKYLAGVLAYTFLLTCALAVQTDITGPGGSGQFGSTVTTLPNGNFVVTDPSYTVTGLAAAGRVYLYNGKTLALISTMTGTAASDNVGSDGVVVLANGDFVVTSSLWNSSRGAVTRCSATTGCPATITSANSLVGSVSDDSVGADGVVALPNGNYVVRSSTWDNGAIADAGAVTWCNGSTGCTGAVSAANSRVGSTNFDQIGRFGVTVLSNGNFVSEDLVWTNNGIQAAGAVTFCSGTAPCTGAVSISNSLVGTMQNEFNGNSGVFPLTNGSYVVCNGGWNNDVGTATFCSSSGCQANVGTANSLTGTNPGDQVGIGGVTALTNGNYVVLSPNWDNGAATNAGAATFCSGSSGCKGISVSTANSLYGTTAADSIGRQVVALTNGSYAVASPDWDNAAAGANDLGAVTFCSGSTGCSGAVTAANSFTGAGVGDRVGVSVTALTNGNYVVASPNWSNPGTGANGAGAVTLCSGTTGRVGQATSANSLVGSSANDNVGSVVALANGNYVVTAGGWNNGAMSDVGAATFCSGTTGCTGAVSAANSLIGPTANNQIGGSTPAVALTNGNYVVLSPGFDSGGLNQIGAVTECGGTSGCTGTVSAANSLVGSSANDSIGSTMFGDVAALPNGNFVVRSPLWNNGALTDAGAVSLGFGTGGTVGPITANNSVRGTVANGGFSLTYSFDSTNSQLIVGRPAENIVTVFPQGAAPTPTLAITSITHLANGHIVLQGTGVPSASHTVERSGTPQGGFSSIGAASTNSAGAFTFEDANAGGLSRAFYRVTYP